MQQQQQQQQQQSKTRGSLQALAGKKVNKSAHAPTNIRTQVIET
jgi:hypothetical protein